MSAYFDVIRRNCEEVVAEVSTPFMGIYYKDGGFGYAAFSTPSGIAEFSCDNMDDFRLLCDTVTEDDGESDPWEDASDDCDEMGFDPYEGCYTYDC